MNLRKSWTEKEDKYVIKNYITKSKESIARKLKRTPNAIKRRANLLGVRKQELPDFWNDKEIQLLKELFPEATKQKILENINRPWTAIRVKAVKSGIRRLNRYRMREGVNHYFFDEWSDNMAYILGFIAADGNVSKNKYKMGIKLSIKDEEHLILIRDLVAPKNKISYSINKDIGNKFVSLEVCSKYMCNSLIKRGIIPRKSLVLKFPVIPEKYIRHFVRGYFDGDGCISKDTNSGYWKSCFLGTQSFLEVINNYLDDNDIVEKKNVRFLKNSNIYGLTYSTYDSIKLAKWMYKDSTIRLERKYKKFQQLFEERKPIMEDY